MKITNKDKNPPALVDLCKKELHTGMERGRQGGESWTKEIIMSITKPKRN